MSKPVAGLFILILLVFVVLTKIGDKPFTVTSSGSTPSLHESYVQPNFVSIIYTIMYTLNSWSVIYCCSVCVIGIICVRDVRELKRVDLNDVLAYCQFIGAIE